MSRSAHHLSRHPRWSIERLWGALLRAFARRSAPTSIARSVRGDGRCAKDRWIASLATQGSIAAILLGGLIGAPAATAQSYNYYRFEASLTTDGEPVNVNIVVRCRYVERRYIGEGRSYAAVRSPYVWGVRTKAGTVVIFQVPDACDQSQTRIPDNLLPVVFWGPKADDLSFLVGYVSEATYSAKNSRMSLPTARITRVGVDEFAAWQAKGEQNWLTNNSDPFRYGPAARGTTASKCYVAYESPLDEKSRARIAAVRPPGAPTYWRAADMGILSLLSFAHKNSVQHQSVLSRLSFARGVPRSPRGGNIGFWDADYYPIEIWPYRQDQGLPWLSDAAIRSPINKITIETKGAFGGAGRLYCYPVWDSTGVAGNRDMQWSLKGHEIQFDDGPTIFSAPRGAPYSAFFRDDAALLSISQMAVAHPERGELP